MDDGGNLAGQFLLVETKPMERENTRTCIREQKAAVYCKSLGDFVIIGGKPSGTN
jgi:hypothetical protein